MRINENAPAVARAGIDVSAPPELVWDVLADFERWPEWNPDVKSVSLNGPLVEGTVFRWKTGPSTITSTLQAVDRPRTLGWTGETFGLHAAHVWQFEAGDGSTHVTTAESFDGWLARLLRKPVLKQRQQAVARGVAHLKAEAERRASV
jgi:uncharacterized protein YndB with AHSA1/START domain